MAIKTITRKDGSQVRFGRRRPISRGPRFSLGNYLTKQLPPPPQSISYTAKATKALGEIYMNDKLGDCVIAGMAHVVGVLTGNSGTKPFLYTNSQIVDLYSAIGGYVPNDPATDNGCDEQTALNYWENQGAPVGSNRIAGWMAVNPADPEEYRTALWLFENLYFGMELPDEWINPFPSASGFTWDVEGNPDPDNGHCVVGVGYNAQGVTIDTWGMTGLLTDAAIAKYAAQSAHGDLYTVVSMDALNKVTEKAPNGFDWSQLVADFDSMGGTIPPPAATTMLARSRSVAKLAQAGDGKRKSNGHHPGRRGAVQPRRHARV